MGLNTALQQALPQLVVKEIQDVYLRKNFQALQNYFTTQNQLMNFNFFDLVFTKAETNFKQAHGFNYVPEDLLITKSVGPGVITFNNGLFDSKNLDISTSDACRVRFFCGTYWNQIPKAKDNESDTMQFANTFTEGFSVTNIYETFQSLITNITTIINNGGAAINIRGVSVSGPISETDDRIICTGAGGITLSLYDASIGVKDVVVINATSGFVTVAAVGGNLLTTGATYIKIGPYNSVTLTPNQISKFYVS